MHLVHVRDILRPPMSHYFPVPHPGKEILLHVCNRVAADANLFGADFQVRVHVGSNRYNYILTLLSLSLSMTDSMWLSAHCNYMVRIRFNNSSSHSKQLETLHDKPTTLDWHDCLLSTHFWFRILAWKPTEFPCPGMAVCKEWLWVRTVQSWQTPSVKALLVHHIVFNLNTIVFITANK